MFKSRDCMNIIINSNLYKLRYLIYDWIFSAIFVKTGKHGSRTTLIVNGYKLHRNKETDNRVFWRCSKRRLYDCKVTAVTLNDCLVRLVAEHNHSNDEEDKGDTKILHVKDRD